MPGKAISKTTDLRQKVHEMKTTMRKRFKPANSVSIEPVNKNMSKNIQSEKQ